MKLFHVEEHKVQPLDPFQELGIAVIKQAAEDYRAIARRLESIENSYEKQVLEKDMESIRHFFLGEWFEVLSDSSNGPMILEMLDREVYGVR